jgi:structural maintenance of chromosome 4
MDEIDAALDFINVNKIAKYISIYNQTSQTILISLRKKMLYRSSLLLGVYKINNQTKIFVKKM